MGFNHKYPYTDLSELNLDIWIKLVEETRADIAAVKKKIDEINIMTEEQINARIDEKIDAYNMIVVNMIARSADSVTAGYQAADAAIDAAYKAADAANKAELTHDINETARIADINASNYAALTLEDAKRYTDAKVVNAEYMIDPITGELSPIPTVIYNIINTFHGDNILTAAEYDALELTATAYDAYELTAQNYDFYGKTYLVGD